MLVDDGDPLAGWFACLHVLDVMEGREAADFAFELVYPLRVLFYLLIGMSPFLVEPAAYRLGAGIAFRGMELIGVIEGGGEAAVAAMDVGVVAFHA